MKISTLNQICGVLVTAGRTDLAEELVVGKKKPGLKKTVPGPYGTWPMRGRRPGEMDTKKWKKKKSGGGYEYRESKNRPKDSGWELVPKKKKRSG